MSTNQTRPTDRRDNPEYLRSVDPEVYEKVRARLNTVFNLLNRTLTATQATAQEVPTRAQVEASVPYIAETPVNEGPAPQNFATAEADEARRDISAVHAAIEEAYEATA